MSRDNRFGFWTLTFLVIGNMIGAGVFTTSGFSLAGLRSPGLVVSAWCVGGLIAIAGAVSYGQLVRHMPESGGEYLFLSRAVHPLCGCIAGWVSLIAGFTGPIAFAAKTFEAYAVPESIRPTWFQDDMLACLVILLCLMWHAIHHRIGEFGQNIVVALKLSMLLAFLLFAVTAGNEKWMGASTAIVETRSSWEVLLAFAGALVWISLSYSGFNAAVYVASEVGDSRTVAKSLVSATVITVALYVLLNAVFVYGPPSALLVDDAGMGKPEVAGIAAQWIGGGRLAVFVRLTIAIALFTSVSSMMLTAPRVYAKMADDGVMPRWMAFANGYPRAAMAAQAFLAIVIVLNSKIAELLNYLSLTLSLSAAGTVACLFAPSIRRNRSGSLFAPLFFVTATLLSATLLAINKPQSLIATGLTVAVGTVGYLLIPRRSSIE